MSKVNVVFWSGTGNTEAMANAVAQGAKSAGAEVDVCMVSAADINALAEEKVIALGCPSMGGEQLEESEMEPFMAELEGKLSGKQVALFGSYGWGNQEWMRDWEERVKSAGATVVNDTGITVNGTPDDSVLEECKALGKTLAGLA